MGYRSDVSIGIAFKDKAHMTNFITKCKLNSVISTEELSFYKVIQNDPPIIGLYFDNVKWYEGFEDVDMHIEFIEAANESGCQTIFLRVGESLDDIEESWFSTILPNGEYTSTEVHVDWHELGFSINRWVEVPDALRVDTPVQTALQLIGESDEQRTETSES